jgi:hypothetical protein
MLATGRAIVEALPVSEVGKCVLGRDGWLFTGSMPELTNALAENAIRFRGG